MNNSLIYILLLIACISCSEPKEKPEISEIHQSLTEQIQFYYQLEYSICNSKGTAINQLFGLVALNRNSDSGISSAYFGLNEKYQPHYLHSMYLKNDWIFDISSKDYNLEDADVIMDSLHSPILLNPNLLHKMEVESNRVWSQKISNKDVKWTFEIKNKPDQLILNWDTKQDKITEIQYHYAVNSDNTYSRKWAFNYLVKSEFTQIEKGFKHQNQTASQPFL